MVMELMISLNAREPSCQNANKDDGLISFEIEGGDLPSGRMPFEIKWEKYDVKTAGFIEMDGSGDLPNLSNQRFSNNLLLDNIELV